MCAAVPQSAAASAAASTCTQGGKHAWIMQVHVIKPTGHKHVLLSRPMSSHDSGMFYKAMPPIPQAVNMCIQDTACQHMALPPCPSLTSSCFSVAQLENSRTCMQGKSTVQLKTGG